MFYKGLRSKVNLIEINREQKFASNSKNSEIALGDRLKDERTGNKISNSRLQFLI